jgi:hypothetical protein
MDPAELDDLGNVLRRLQGDVALLRRDLSLPLWAASRLGWLPVVGPTVESVPVLFTAGESLLDASITVWDVVGEPVVPMLSDGSSGADALLESVVRNVRANDARLYMAAARVNESLMQVEAIRTEELLPVATGPMERVQALAPLVRAAFEGVPLVPNLLAPSQGNLYLLLAQNNDELRPTGGFISSIATVDTRTIMTEGISFMDSYQVEDWKQPHPDPPEALREHMGLDLWVTRDGNWWPDFPTSAEAVADLYELNQGRRVDGMVAVDVMAAARFMETLTPLELSNGEVLERGQVMESFRRSWSLPPESLITSGVVVTATQPFSEIELALHYNEEQGRVWFDGVALEPTSEEGTNLVLNPSFERDADQDGLPDGWRAVGLSRDDGLVTDHAYAGNRSLTMMGEGGQKSVVQRLDISGEKGSSYRLVAQSRAYAAVSKGGYELTVRFLDDQGEVASVDADFPGLTHDWATVGSSKIMGRWWRHRKDFMNHSIRAAMKKLLSDPSKVPWLDLLTLLEDLFAQRHVQLYARDPAVQDFLQRHGWDGAMIEAEGDYLLCVDSNVGYNKVNSNVDQTISYTVDIDEAGNARAQLAIHYVNHSEGQPGPCNKFEQYVPTYEALAHGCYWDYVRVYVPSGTELIEAQGGDETVDVFSELDRTVFAAYFVLRPGEERALRFAYDLPSRMVRDGVYQLDVQKQAGTRAVPLQVAISGPGKPTIGSNPGAAGDVQGDKAIYDTDLLVDRHFSVEFADGAR